MIRRAIPQEILPKRCLRNMDLVGFGWEIGFAVKSAKYL
jgi:hypothetical protein